MLFRSVFAEGEDGRLGGKAVAVADCPLVDLAAVYRRRTDGKTLTIAPSGWTYQNTFVLCDRETDTPWYPCRKRLTGIQGTDFRRWLPKLPSGDAAWDRWRAENPSSEILGQRPRGPRRRVSRRGSGGGTACDDRGRVSGSRRPSVPRIPEPFPAGRGRPRRVPAPARTGSGRSRRETPSGFPRCAER